MSIAKFLRTDSWKNLAMGFGTERDKRAGTYFAPSFELSGDTLANLYSFNFFAQRIVNVYPQEALREGFPLANFDPKDEEKIEDFLEPLNLPEIVEEAATWGRLFGGCATLVGANDGAVNLAQPLGSYSEVSFLRNYDARFVTPLSWYRAGAKVGEPETYSVSSSEQGTSITGVVHESRLVLWRGVRTEKLARRRLRWWDYSVLQAAYEALMSDGTAWASIETMLTDASQGVFKIKNLMSMIAGKQKDLLLERMKLMDMVRSVGRSLLLDKEDEDFNKIATQFTGIAELDTASLRRVAAAAGMPMQILLGEEPSGLNASGATGLQWFNAHVMAYRRARIVPPLKRLFRLILNGNSSPIALEAKQKLCFAWPPLWQPTSKERAEISKLNAETDQIYVQNEIVLPEEVAVSRFSGEDSPLKINVEMRQAVLETDLNKTQLPENSAAASIELAPTDIAKVVSVNEARAANNLPPLSAPDGTEDPNGRLTIAEYFALKEASAISAASAGASNAIVPEPPPEPAAPPPPGEVAQVQEATEETEDVNGA